MPDERDPWLPATMRARVALAQAENRMVPAVRAAMNRYLGVTRAAVLRHDTSHVHRTHTRPRTPGGLPAAASSGPDPRELPPNLDGWPPRAVWSDAAHALIIPVSTATWRDGWTDTLTPEQAAQLNDADYLDEHLADTSERLTGASWPDEVYDEVRAEVTEGLRAGENIDDIRVRIAQVLQLARWAARALGIARNEVMAARNGGAYRAGLARQSVFGEQMNKTWLAVMDKRTRPAHRSAHGTSVPADQAFNVGGESLRYPHDPRGSPAETALCRCVLNWYTAAELDAGTQQSLYSTDSGSSDMGDTTTETPVAASTAPTAAPPAPLVPATVTADLGTATNGDGTPTVTITVTEETETKTKVSKATSRVVPADDSDDGDGSMSAAATTPPPAPASPAPVGQPGHQPVTEPEYLHDAYAITDDLANCDGEDPEPDGTGDGTSPVTASVTTTTATRTPATPVVAADFTPSGKPTAAKRRRAENNGHALPGGRYPIENGADLDKAITAAHMTAKDDAPGRTVRRHIIKHAKRLGQPNKIPARWNADGTRKKPAATAASAAPGTPARTTSWVEQVAAGVPMEPDPACFQTPPMGKGTKMHVLNDQGWVAGYIADWDALHRVYKIPPPRDPYGGTYPKFHRHRIRCSDGTVMMTGPVATNGHGDPGNTDLASVMQHYDDPRYVAAAVRVVEDENGIWASGTLRTGVSPFQVALLDTYSQSGHWMPGPSGHAQELVASCCVTVEAFELDPNQRMVASLAAAAGPDAGVLATADQVGLVDDDGQCVVLVAAGIVAPEPAPTVTASVDAVAFYRQFKAVEKLDADLVAARRRVRTDPAVTAAVTRIRKGA